MPPKKKNTDDATTTFDTRQAHIEMLSVEEAKAATIQFEELSSASGVEHLKKVLGENGFAVVANVLTDEDVKHAEALWGGDLMSIVAPTAANEEASLLAMKQLGDDPVHRWPLEKFPLVCRQGIAKFTTDYGLPHGAMPWYCRKHPNVQRVFSSLFNTEEICCGMDVIFFNNRGVVEDAERAETESIAPQAFNAAQAPQYVRNLKELTTTLWPHADQNGRVLPAGQHQVYQGVLYLWPADEQSSSTIVWPRSHQEVYPKLMDGIKHDRHYCALPAKSKNAEDAPYTREAFVKHARRVPVPAGGMLLWDSKALHQGWPHGKRLALPIGYEPVDRRSEEVKKAKIQLTLDGLPTDHWGSLGLQHRMARGIGKQAPTEDLQLLHAAHKRRHLITEDGSLVPDVAACL